MCPLQLISVYLGLTHSEAVSVPTGMMLTTALSYLSHSQVWALQQGNLLHISGKTNRAKNEFQQELAVLTELVPEHAPGR